MKCLDHTQWTFELPVASTSDTHQSQSNDCEESINKCYLTFFKSLNNSYWFGGEARQLVGHEKN
jgi:hypothetical protein